MSEYRERSENRIEEPEKIDITGLLQDIWQGIRKFWWLVIGLAAIFALRAYFSVSSSYQPTYVASATMAVGTRGTYVDVQSAKQMEKVFPYILTSGVLKEVVAADMGLDAVPGVILAKAEEGTNLFTVSVSSDDPQMAYNVLQSVIKNYPKVARFVIGETNLQILDETGLPTDTGRKSVIRGSFRNGALKGAAIGLLIMAFYILTRKTVKSRKELRRAVNLEDFGSIPFIFGKKRRKDKFRSSLNLMNERVPQGYVEAIRKLRIRIMKEMEKKNYQTLLVTSSVPGEGKTTLATNLAIAIAKQGKKVILVDCDTRNPSVAEAMNAQDKYPGLGMLIRSKANLSQALVPVEVSGGSLEILYGGEPNNKDANILGTKSMSKLLEVLKKRADIVVLDTAPSELLADASTLAKFVDAALYVVKYDHARIRHIRSGIQTLSLSGVDILGYVFNADQEKSRQGYNYGYSYGYKRYGSYGHYGKYRGIGKKEDTSGRVMKD